MMSLHIPPQAEAFSRRSPHEARSKHVGSREMRPVRSRGALSRVSCDLASGASSAQMNELELKRLRMEYEDAMSEIDMLVEANQGDLPRGRAIAELFEKSFVIGARINELRRNQKTR